MVVVVVLARRLGPASFGLFVFVQWLIDMTSLVCSGGLPSAATRFFPQTAGSGSTVIPGFGRWFLRWGFVAVVLTCFVATLSTIAFSDLAEAAPLAVVPFWAASSAAWALLGARAQGLFQFKRYAVSSALFVAVALTGLTLPRLGNDLLAAMLCFGAANFAAAAVCALGLSGAGLKDGAPLTKLDVRLIRSYATNAWLTSIASSFVWARGEISVVKGHLGESAVGFYSVGLTLSGIVNQGMALLTGGLWPQIASGWDNNERQKVLRLSSLVTSGLMLAAGVSAGFVICFAPYLIALLFGPAFLQSSSLVLILAFGALGLSSGPSHLVLQAATNGRFARNVTLAGGLALFGAAFLLVPHFGVVGAAVARSATQIAVGVLTLVWIGRAVGHTPETRQNLRAFLLLVSVGLVLVTILILAPNLQLTGRALLFGIHCCFVAFLCGPVGNGGTLRQLRSLAGGGHA